MPFKHNEHPLSTEVTRAKNVGLLLDGCSSHEYHSPDEGETLDRFRIFTLPGCCGVSWVYFLGSYTHETELDAYMPKTIEMLKRIRKPLAIGAVTLSTHEKIKDKMLEWGWTFFDPGSQSNYIATGGMVIYHFVVKKRPSFVEQPRTFT